MKSYDVTRLTERVRLEYGYTQENARKKAIQTLETCPNELIPNVEEWAKGQKLTDIYIGQYSLPMILAIQNSRDFLKAPEVDRDGSIWSSSHTVWKSEQ